MEKSKKCVRKKSSSKKCTKKVKRKRLCYSRENVALALKELSKGARISQVSLKYNIPESTIRAKKNGIYADKKPGPATVLTAQEEKDLVDWIIISFNNGFPVTKSQLFESVKVICTRLQRKNPFINNTPGRAWYEGFLKRHPEVVKKVFENVSSNKAKVSKSSLQNWFEEVKDHLTAENLIDIEPERIFNCDEIDLPLNPAPSFGLKPKGHKNVCKVVNNNEKQSIKVLVTANAAGILAPSFVLFNGKTLPNDVAKLASSKIALSCSDNGWMLAENFYEYMANIFEPWLTENKIKRPVIMYISGHSSCMTLHLSQFCSDKQIVLITLDPKATHITEPLDVSLFKTLKVNWLKIVQEFCEKDFSVGVHINQFPPLLQKTFDSMELENILQNGFKKCGLYPFNVNVIDFNNVTKRNISTKGNKSTHDVSTDIPTEENEENDNVETTQSNSLKVLESLLNKDQIKAFRLNNSPIWQGEKKDEGLFDIWYNLRHGIANNANLLNTPIHKQTNAELDSLDPIADEFSNHGASHEQDIFSNLKASDNSPLEFTTSMVDDIHTVQNGKTFIFVNCFENIEVHE